MPHAAEPRRKGSLCAVHLCLPGAWSERAEGSPSRREVSQQATRGDFPTVLSRPRASEISSLTSECTGQTKSHCSTVPWPSGRKACTTRKSYHTGSCPKGGGREINTRHTSFIHECIPCTDSSAIATRTSGSLLSDEPSIAYCVMVTSAHACHTWALLSQS